MIPGMRLPSALTWLIDEASSVPGPDQFLTTLGAQLISDGLPLSGGALTLAAPHPIIARRAWLWRAQTGAVIEALGFGSLDPNETRAGQCRPRLAGRARHRAGLRVCGGPGSRQSDVRRLQGRTAQCLGGPPRDPLRRRNPRCCKRWRGSLLRLSPCWSRDRLWRRCSRPISADAVQRRCWRGGCGEKPARLSGRFYSMAICVALPSFRRRWHRRRLSARSARGSTASPAPFTPSAAKCLNSSATACWRSFRSANGILPPPATPRCAPSLRPGPAWRTWTLLAASRACQPLPFGMALHLGEMLWGNIGSADRLDFTAIGSDVNLVVRLEGMCRPLGRSVLISGAVAAETAVTLIPLGEHVLRGIAEPCAIFALPEQ